MAGEWIKVRRSLRRDPRVMAIADHLAENRSFINWITDPMREQCDVTVYEYVTRDVTVRVTVSALIEVWCTANEAGEPDGDDLVMRHCTLDALDLMADMPGIGEAMAAVDWAIQEQDARGKPCVRLPKFLNHNTPASERHRSPAAERQRRYRQRKAQDGANGDVTRDVTRDASSDVTGDVTVTPREEKRREDIKTPLPPKGGKSPLISLKTFLEQCKEKGEKAIPETDPIFDYAEEIGVPGEYLELAWQVFRDEYLSRDKRYRDWRAHFRTYIRKNYHKLWWIQPDGTFALTTTGKQAERVYHKGVAHG